MEFLEALQRLSQSPHQLRVNLVDTIAISNGSISAWFYTNSNGEVDRAEEHELVPSSIMLKLLAMQASSEDKGIVAVAHYQSGLRKPLNETELESLVSFSTRSRSHLVSSPCLSHS